jgi:hypothetical protein
VPLLCSLPSGTLTTWTGTVIRTLTINRTLAMTEALRHTQGNLKPSPPKVPQYEIVRFHRLDNSLQPSRITEAGLRKALSSLSFTDEDVDKLLQLASLL